MRVAFLTSSRADFGIYLPLLVEMKKDPFFDLRLIVFGTHLSAFHGYTMTDIDSAEFTTDYRIENTMASDTPEAIATSMAVTGMKFASVWQREQLNYELVFCLGDRYEMFAAVSAGVPFNIKFAHIHGGETTLGSIDNQFRHCISIFSKLHFTSTEQYAKRVSEITGDQGNIHVVGALSLDNLSRIALLDAGEFQTKYHVDLRKPTLLVTYHPETVKADRNSANAEQLVAALNAFNNYQIIITMPNADTTANGMRSIYTDFASKNHNVRIIENFGTLGYFSCMALSKIVVGNSSSGIIEAASLRKYVVNIGNRQKGRAVSDNIVHAVSDSQSIIMACREAISRGDYEGRNIYHKPNASRAIIDILKVWKP